MSSKDGCESRGGTNLFCMLMVRLAAGAAKKGRPPPALRIPRRSSSSSSSRSYLDLADLASFVNVLIVAQDQPLSGRNDRLLYQLLQGPYGTHPAQAKCPIRPDSTFRIGQASWRDRLRSVSSLSEASVPPGTGLSTLSVS